MANVNDTYFDGQYKDIWKALIPEMLTVKETEFFIDHFKLSPADKILDLMCGYGRHTLALSRKGFAVAAVDNSTAYIREIAEAIDREKLPATVLQADIAGYIPQAGKFRLAICMGNSLNFFDREDAQKILKRVSNALLPGGYLVINTWSLAEIAYRQFTEVSDGETAGTQIHSISRFLFRPDRIESETQMKLPNGEIEIRNAIDYIFSINEMEALLKECGFSLEEIYSIPGRKKFTLGDPRAYLIARKIN